MKATWRSGGGSRWNPEDAPSTAVMRRKLPFLLVLLLGLAVFLFRPVCVPLSDKDLGSFTVPIEQRTERDFYLKVFQTKNGRWYQCKMWISRLFFA